MPSHRVAKRENLPLLVYNIYIFCIANSDTYIHSGVILLCHFIIHFRLFPFFYVIITHRTHFSRLQNIVLNFSIQVELFIQGFPIRPRKSNSHKPRLSFELCRFFRYNAEVVAFCVDSTWPKREVLVGYF